MYEFINDYEVKFVTMDAGYKISIVSKSHMKKPSKKVDGFFNDIRCTGDMRRCA